MKIKNIENDSFLQEVLRRNEIMKNRYLIIYNNLTPWQYYKWDKEDLYKLIYFYELYIDNLSTPRDKSLYELDKEIYIRLIKWGVIKEKTKEEIWEERETRRKEKWKSVVAKILNF